MQGQQQMDLHVFLPGIKLHSCLNKLIMQLKNGNFKNQLKYIN